ncbi:MAG: hypothetical protein J6V36_01705, partial [Clostridia bacterium]|nr:hypothetical protein [Clostridia bacterium]
DGGQSRSTVLTGVKLESGVYSIPLRISEEKGDSFGVIDIPKSLVQDREGVFAVKAPFGFEKKNIVKGDILVAKAGSDIQKGDTVIFDDLSLGIIDDKSDSFQEDISDIDELEILDGFEDIKEEVQDFSEVFEKKKRLVLGKVIVCIRHL